MYTPENRTHFMGRWICVTANELQAEDAGAKYKHKHRNNALTPVDWVNFVLGRLKSGTLQG